MATTSERRKIIKANKYMKSEAQMKAETQAYIKKQAEEQKKAKSDAGFVERYTETAWDIEGKLLSGVGKGVEGIVDLLIGGVGLVGGIFSEDFKEGAKRAVEYDVVGNLYGNAIEERTADSWLNDNKVGEVVEQVAEGVGEMLPTVLVAIATGGTSAAASGASAASSAGAAASAASKAAKVSRIASTATMAASAAGRGAEEALNDGAELEGAMAYGALSGATEAVTENLVGGVFGKSLNVGKGAAKTGAKRVIQSMAEEAGEEVLAEAVSPLLKTTYKGSDALYEYFDPEYYKGVLQAGLVGGLTSAAYGGTVGHAIHSVRGTNADVDAVIDSMSDINKEKDKLFAKGKMSAAKYADMQSNIKANMQSVETVLKKASPEQRQKLIEKYKLEGLFDGDGNLDAEYVARLDKRIEAGRTGEFSPYVSPDLAADRERLASDLDALNADPQNFENVSDDVTGNEFGVDNAVQLQYNKKGMPYDSFSTEAMKWAFSTKTKPGDVKLFYNSKDNTWNKLVADDTEDRYATVLSIQDTPENEGKIKKLYKEVDSNGNHGEQQRISEGVHKDYDRYWSFSTGDRNDNRGVEEQGANGRSREVHGSESDGDGDGNSRQSDRNKRGENLKYSRYKGQSYDSFSTEAMKWARATVRQKGDRRALYNAKNNTWNLIEAVDSDDMFVVVKSVKDTSKNLSAIENLMKEVRNDSNRAQSRSNKMFYENIDVYWAVRRNDKLHSSDVRERGADGRNGGVYQGKSEHDGEGASRQGDSNKRGETLKYSRYKEQSDGDYVYTENQYNHFGWAREVGAISKNELDDLYSKIQQSKSLSSFKKSENGEYIVEVNDAPNTMLGVNNVFVFVKGAKANFIITRTIRFDAQTEIEMEIYKEVLYEGRTCRDTYLSLYQAQGLTREYRRKDTSTFVEYAKRRVDGEASRRAYRDNRRSDEYRNGYTFASGEVRKNEIASDGDEIRYSREGNGEKRNRVRIFDGEFDNKGKEYYSDVKRAANNLNAISGRQFNIALVNGNVNFKGVIVNGDNIYINADRVQSGNAIGDLIHELTHFTEGSREYNALMKLLVSDTDSLRRKIVELTREGNAYGFTPETVENLSRMVSESDTDENAEQEYADKEPQVQYSKNDNFKSEIDEWSRDGKPDGQYFILGTTGDVLQGLGAIESDIYMRSDKINTILKEHPEMTLDEIKKIPEILEDPVLILKSRNVGRENKSNTRLVIFGSIKAKNGQPVLSVLDLRPNEKNLVIDDMQKLTSAYTKTQNATEFVRNSDVVYADKKRTTPLLRAIGFQMPIALQQSGYIGSISYSRDIVNISGKNFSEIVNENISNQKSQNMSVNLGIQFPNVITSLDSNTIIHQSKAFVNTNSENISEADVSDGETATGLEGELLSEIVAGLAEDSIGMDGAFIDKLVRGNDTLAAKLLNKIESMTAYLASRKTPEAREQYKRLKQAEKLFTDALAATGKTYRRGNVVGAVEEEEEDEASRAQYSYHGKAEDGRGIYSSNFPKGTPKSAKSERILNYIKNVWSKKPIELVISNGETSRTIFAKFDPTVDESKQTPTDSSKLAGGNRHGTHAEQRVTLDLAEDYYQIASESKYNYSKEETGKSAKTHEDVRMWHYFVNDIYFAEYGESELVPYTVTINVKEKDNGDFVYSFNAEKEPSTQRTLHAAVSTRKGANGELFLDDSIHQNSENVKSKLQYSRINPNESDRIGVDTNEEERARILRSRTFTDVPNIDDVPKNVIDRISKIKTREEIGVYFEKQKKNIQNKIASEFRVVNGYANRDINLFFDISESVYKGSKDFDNLAKLLSVFDKVVNGSVGIQYERIYNDPDLKKIFTMIGAFDDGDNIILVCFEIKEHPSNDVTVGVSFDSLKKSDVYNSETSEGVINVPTLFKEINPQSTHITKHIPVRLLVKAQLEKLKQMTSAQMSKKEVKISKYEAETKRGETVSRKWNTITAVVREIKDVKKGAYIRASEYQNHVFRKTFEKIDKILWRGPMRDDFKVRVELSYLREWYSNKQNRLFHDEDGAPNDFFRPDIIGELEILSDLSKDGFSIAELDMLIHVLKYVKEGIRYHNEMFVDGKWRHSRTEGQNYYVIQQEAKRAQTGISRLIIGKYARQFADNASIYRAADGYNENGFFTKNFTALRDGLVNMATENYELFERYDAFLEDKSNKDYVKRLTEEKLEYRGNTLTVGKFISLYMTSKRKQSWAALVKMGFAVYDDKDRVDFSRLAENPDDVPIEDEDWEDVVELCAPYIESMQTEMEQMLTERDRQYIEIVEEIYQKCAVMKEKTDKIRFGIGNIINDYYYPLRRYDVAKKVGMYAEVNTTLNMPFNKDTRLSTGKLLIESVDTVLKRHAEGVLLYSNFAIWSDNFNKVLNVELGDEFWKNKTLRGEFDKTAVYRDVLNHLMKLEKDITSGKILDDPEVQKIFSFLRSSYAKAQLGANLKVLPTQLSSYLAAGSILDYNCIARAFTVKGAVKEVDKYCSLAKVRHSDNTAVKAITVTDKVGKVGDALLTPIGLVDRRVIGGLFGACQLQVQKDKGLRLGTHENKVEAGKLLEKVILETQQNSLLTERSAAMRSNNEFIKALVMFTADANKIMGRVLDGMGEVSVIKRKLKLIKANPDKNAAEIAKLENERAEISADLQSDNKIAEENGSVIEISTDSELARRIENSDKSKYTVIKEYLVENFYGKEFVLSDGKRAIMDKRDAQELSHKADNRKVAELSNLVNIVEKAELFAEENNVKHNKFKSFSYYAVSIKFNGQEYSIVLNVGQSKNDNKYHIYDITNLNEKRRAANQSPTGLSQVTKTDAIKNDSSDSGNPILSNPRKSVEQTVSRTTTSTNSIPENSQNVNSISENNRSEIEERLAAIDERLDYLRNEKKHLEQDLKRAEKKLYRSVSALVSSSIYMALLSLAFKLLYGKYKDKELEEITADTVFDFFGNMLGGLPIYSDIYSFITDGYEVDIFALDMFNQLLYACTSSITLAKDALSGKDVTRQDIAATVKKVVVSTGMLFGIPVRNAYNLTSGLLNTFLPQTGYALNDFFGETSRSADLKRAIENEDEKMIGVITSLMIGEGDTEYTATTEKALNGLLAEGYSVLPRSVGDTVTYNGVAVELDRTQKKKIKSIYSEADKAVNSLTSLSEFQKAPSDVRAKAIRFINNLYYRMALDEVLGDGEKSKYELFAVGIDVYRLAIIIALAQSIEADKDANGNAISGSKKKKVMDFIEAQRLTAAQKHMLAGALGYTNTKGEQKVTSYISTLPLTQQEKSRLLEYSGYKVA